MILTTECRCSVFETHSQTLQQILYYTLKHVCNTKEKCPKSQAPPSRTKTTMSHSHALSDRDTNLLPTSQPMQTDKPTSAGEENKPQTMEYHRQVLEQKIADNNGCVETASGFELP